MPREDEIAVQSPVRRGLPTFTDSLIEPLSRLRNEVDRLFDDFPASWHPFQFRRFPNALLVPAVEMTETQKAYKLSVEVPGMEASDINMHVDGNMLVISGEKKEEREEEEKGYSYSERSYGAFERRLDLPAGADAQNIKAKVRKGVLQITLPKDRKAINKRRIQIDNA
jgi:HSP20 family protein